MELSCDPWGFHALSFFCCRLEIYPDGKHNIHLRYADQFNSAVDDFLGVLQ